MGYEIFADEDWVRWRLNGQYHRTDGPAVIWPSGTQGWYLNDNLLTKDEWRQQTD